MRETMHCLNKICCLLVVAALIAFNAAAQIKETQKLVTDGDTSYIEVQTLDTIVFSPYASIQSVEALIALLQSDTTFYKAFKNLHFSSYHADHSISFYNKKRNTIIAQMKAETQNVYRGGCRQMHILEENITGNYYKSNKEPKYYTAALYNDLFYEKEKICNKKNILSKDYLQPKGGAIEKNKAQLKLLMFNPGTPIKGIPLMGNKAAIFDPEIAKLYNFRIETTTKNGVSCYLFEAIPKPEHRSKVVYQLFRTWLDDLDFHIVAREYQLSYQNALYDFDVYIKVNLINRQQQLLVKDIFYDGNWRVISKGREVAKFKTVFYH